MPKGRVLAPDGTGMRFCYSAEPLPDNRRCTHIRQNGQRCHNERSKDLTDTYCAYHAKFRNGKRTKRDRALRHMPNFYSRHLTKSLAEVLREALDQNPQEQLQLYEELALLRDLAGQSVAYYAIAKDNFANANSETDANNKRGILFAAGELMRDHLNDVVKVCDTAAKVAAQGKDTVMLSQLHYFVEQVTRCAYEAFGDDPRREKFKQMLEAKVRLPQVDVNGNGTRLTPDMDALAMDSTVPKDNSVIDIELVDSFYKRKEDNVSPSTNGE